MKNAPAKSKAGVVKYYTENSPKALVLEEPSVLADYSPGTLLKELRKGLPFAELEALQSSLAVPLEKLAGFLGISKATLHRRRASGRLDIAESDRVVRYARLMGLAHVRCQGADNHCVDAAVVEEILLDHDIGVAMVARLHAM